MTPVSLVRPERPIFLNSPKLLFFFSPTGALDKASELRIINFKKQQVGEEFTFSIQGD